MLQATRALAPAGEFVDNPAVSDANDQLSRRTWLLASGSIALLGALSGCQPRDPTRVPEGGPAPAGPLSERGVRNLLALAQLSAAIRWLHPSDQASAVAWEPLVLEGIRELEQRQDPEQLAEGLRGLLGEVAPTLQLWRAAIEELPSASEGLEGLACPDPEAAEETPSRARPAANSLTHGKGQSHRPGPPGRTTRGKPEEDSETGESSEKTEKAEAPKKGDVDEPELEVDADEPELEVDADEPELDVDADEPELDVDTDDADADDAEKPAKPDAEQSKPEKPEKSEKSEKSEQPEKPEKSEQPEPRPPLPAALLRETDAIVQWWRRGFPIDAKRDRDPSACARRIVRPPDRCVEQEPKRRRDSSACLHCDREFDLLAPAAPLLVELGRGLSAAIPLALWHEGGEPEPALGFDAEQAAEYTLDDRGTRLLAVIQAWSVLRWFSPRSPLDPIAPLRRALCEAAEADAAAMPAILEVLLASFGEGNAQRLGPKPRNETRGKSREFVPAAGFAWAAERVVAFPLVDRPDELAPLQTGDVIVAIAGESIEARLAQMLPRTSAASSRVQIARAVDRLFVGDRARAKAGLRVEVTRVSDQGEARLELELDRWLALDRRPSGGDLRPSDSLIELRPGTWYADLGRIPNLRMAARWLREAEAVIVDLRGPLLDERDSLASHWASEALELLDERILVGPTHEGRFVPVTVDQHRLEPAPLRLRLRCPVVALADHRTRGRAELELVAFDRLGAAIVGSHSAGDLARCSEFMLPGGSRIRFGQTDVLRHDGTWLTGVGVAPTHPIAPSWPRLAERDELLEHALRSLDPAGASEPNDDE